MPDSTPRAQQRARLPRLLAQTTKESFQESQSVSQLVHAAAAMVVRAVATATVEAGTLARALLGEVGLAAATVVV
jgi:hypothetical protein